MVSIQTGDDHQVLEGLGPSMKIHDPSGFLAVELVPVALVGLGLVAVCSQ